MKNTKEKLVKSKHFFTFCLAGFISVLTLFGTACTPTQSKTNQETTPPTVQSAPSALGLDPKTDPIIYTTESGLEIKYGGIDLNASLASGALQGYPYFTMGTYSNKPVNWVIIGRNSNVATFNNPFSAKLFSSWLSTNNVFAQYFKNNFYETSTPAGSAINSSTAPHGFIQDTAGAVSLSSVKDNDSEIPSGSVLAISECVLGSATNADTYTPGNVCKTIDAMYTSTLGISTTIKNLIKPMNLKTSTYSNTYTTVSNKYLFPLAATWSLTGDFLIDTYLSTYDLRIAYNIGTSTATTYWTRSGDYGTDSQVVCVKSDGSFYPYNQNNTYGIRPACVISLQ